MARSKLLTLSAFVDEKGNEPISYVSGPNLAPLTVRRISTLCVMNSRRISRLTRRNGEGRLTAATKTVFLTRRKRDIKATRREEEQTSLHITE
ncbi:hypothetical protein CesoFtcFv8_022908 [Champsocephalus esox]|uniref:Uncharacterized protein n=1 Tax=Champsocephalus esox TaxID=159716 RepID=A0AAN8B7S5_9TELE|nr:hypothetical protein CesoFtcFv8_022908 [Champsocephalus esox]